MSILPIRDLVPNCNEAADRLLVRLILEERSESAFRQLYRSHTPALERLLRAAGIDDEDHLDDIVQETWMRASRILDRFSWRSSFRTWLAGIASNVRREGRRAARLREVRLTETQLASVPDDRPGEPLEGRGPLDALLDGLPARLRTVFELRAVDGLSHTEIAKRLGITAAAVRVRYLRARRQLRDRLRTETAEEEDPR